MIGRSIVVNAQHRLKGFLHRRAAIAPDLSKIDEFKHTRCFCFVFLVKTSGKNQSAHARPSYYGLLARLNDVQSQPLITYVVTLVKRPSTAGLIYSPSLAQNDIRNLCNIFGFAKKHCCALLLVVHLCCTHSSSASWVYWTIT